MGFGKEIKRLREEANISVQKLAEKIGVDAERWRKWEAKDLTPRLEDTAAIEAFFGMDLNAITGLESIKKFLIVPRESKEPSNTDVNEPEAYYSPVNGLNVENITLRVLADLAASHKNLTAAHKELAESNNALAKSQETLLAKIPSTDGGSKEIPIEISNAFAGVIAALSKLAVGKLRYKTEQEAAIELGKFVPLPGQGKT